MNPTYHVLRLVCRVAVEMAQQAMLIVDVDTLRSARAWFPGDASHLVRSLEARTAAALAVLANDAARNAAEVWLAKFANDA